MNKAKKMLKSLYMNSSRKNLIRFLLTIIILFLFKISFSQVSKDTFKNNNSKIEYLLQKGQNNYYSQPNTAYIYYKQVLKLSKENKNTLNEAHSSLYIGEYFNHKGAYKKSLEYYLNAIDLYKSIDNKKGIATSYNYIAYSFSLLNSLDKSIEYYTKSLKIFKEINDRKGIADIYNGFGSLNYG